MLHWLEGTEVGALRMVVDYAVVEDIFLGWDLGAVGARLLEENGLVVTVVVAGKAVLG